MMNSRNKCTQVDMADWIHSLSV